MNAKGVSASRAAGSFLRRCRKHLGGIDWRAVLIELAVVVLGILIAFELTNWGERRERRQAEAQLLQRIEEEARGDLKALQIVRDEHLQSANNYRLLAQAVTDPQAHAAYHRRGQAQCNLLRLPAVPRQSAGAGGLAAGERLELVSDSQLRSLLRKADAYRSFSDGQLSFFRESFQRYSVQIEPHMVWRFAGADVPVCGVNIDSLRADPKAIALLPKLARDQRQFARYRSAELQATAAVINRVACLRSGMCAG